MKKRFNNMNVHFLSGRLDGREALVAVMDVLERE
jgi:hypothetical protein